MNQMISAREAQRSDAEATNKPGLAVVMATKRAISKFRKPTAAVGKSAAAGGNANAGSNTGSSVGKKMVLAMEVSYLWHFRQRFCFDMPFSGCGATTRTPDSSSSSESTTTSPSAHSSTGSCENLSCCVRDTRLLTSPHRTAAPRRTPRTSWPIQTH
jgi:hypothetical protein